MDALKKLFAEHPGKVLVGLAVFLFAGYGLVTGQIDVEAAIAKLLPFAGI